MKKLFLILSLIIFIVCFSSCKTDTPQDENIDIGITDENSDGVQQELEILPSKFADFLTSRVSARAARDATYYIEKTVTENGSVTSVITAVKNGKILNITENNGVKTATLFAPGEVITFNIEEKTYFQTACDDESYNNALKIVECAEKYSGIEFTPSAYTVIDTDYYAEVAIIDDTPHIYIFDENYDLKYIVYALTDGSLVTEEIFTFTSEVDDGLFEIPADYTAA